MSGKKPSSRFKPTNLQIEQYTQNESITTSGNFIVEENQKISEIGIISSTGTPLIIPTPTEIDFSSLEVEPESLSTEESTPSLLEEEQKLIWSNIEIVKKIGSGNSSIVFKCLDKSTEKIYAMKVLEMENEEKIKPITSEVQVLSKCSYPAIIHLYDAFLKNRKIHLIIEYMNYGSLNDIMNIYGPIPENISSQIAYWILKGLVHIHSKNTIHRDLKPENILLNSKGEVKISDFGMSGYKKIPDELEDSWTTFQGTYTYMSPERIAGTSHSYKSDIWSLGILIGFISLGDYPFNLRENTIWELMALYKEEKFVEKIKMDKFSAELIEFLNLCLKYEVDERSNAKELLKSDWILKYKKSKPSIGRWLDESVKSKINAL
eukprot:gene615-8119_t